MYYNNLQEVVKLIQSWMPLISIRDNERIANEVYETIISNTKALTTKEKYATP